MQTQNQELVEQTITVPVYEAPKIESVLTPEALEREVHYAGNNISLPPV